MPNIKLVIFDLDGTLIDAYKAINSSFNYVMSKLGLRLRSAKRIRKAVGWGDLQLLKPFVSKADLPRAALLYRRHHARSLLKHSRLYPQVRSLLEELKTRGLKLAVASNRPSKFSLILLKHLKLRKFFDLVLCADQLKHGKPSPEILNKIVKRLGLKKSQTLYVGDMVIDAQAGSRAKINTVIVMGGSSSRAQIVKEKPFKIIVKIGGLKDLL